ncbi:MAG TPA: hypothetical protein VFJ16_25055 [Longimicrobium sp.]|nr:hypothetical protein [Longimicrobium sp.]
MRTIHATLARTILYIALSSLWAISYPNGLIAQNSVDLSTGEVEPRTRPMACPIGVHGGVFGWWFGYEHAGYEWTDDWQRDRILDPVNYAKAEYVPEGDPDYIVSRDGRARWRNPRFVAECWITEYWFLGRIIQSDSRVIVKANLGSVEPCGRPQGWAEMIDYDPYEPEPPESECTPGEENGDSDPPPPGSGTQFEPGDYTNGETVDWNTGIGNGGISVCGTAAVVEYICIEIYNEFTGNWDPWECGYATTC